MPEKLKPIPVEKQTFIELAKSIQEIVAKEQKPHHGAA